MSKVRVLSIIKGTSVDGPGLRTSIYFAGCTHRCPGCHNPESWNPNGGKEYEVEELFNQELLNDPWDITFTGGDPIFQYTQVLQLAGLISQYTSKTMWLYTGYTIDHLMDNVPSFRYELAPKLEAVVDGPFVMSKKVHGLQFRGSSNQRIIYLRPTEDMVEDSIVYEE